MPDRNQMQRELERAQRDGLARLRELQQAQLAEDKAYLLAQRRIVGLCLETLRLYDQAYLQVQAYASQPFRDEHFQSFLNDKAAALLRELELNIFRVLQEAIQHIRSDLPHTRPRERVVREVIIQPAPPLRSVVLRFIRENRDVLMFCYCLLLGYLSYLVFDNTLWVGLLVPVICFVASRDLWWMEIIFGLVMVIVLLSR